MDKKTSLTDMASGQTNGGTEGRIETPKEAFRRLSRDIEMLDDRIDRLITYVPDAIFSDEYHQMQAEIEALERAREILIEHNDGVIL